MNPSNTIMQIVERQFVPSLEMLRKTIENCPDEFWSEAGRGVQLWQRILHAVEGLDYWFSENGEYYFEKIDKKVSAEIDVPCADVLSKEEMLSYFGNVEAKCLDYLRTLDDALLLSESKKHPDMTELDIIFMQVRHVQLNIGYCNERLNAAECRGAPWIGYEEDDEA